MRVGDRVTLVGNTAYAKWLGIGTVVEVSVDRYPPWDRKLEIHWDRLDPTSFTYSYNERRIRLVNPLEQLAETAE